MNYVRRVNTEVVVCSPQSLTDCMGIETRPLQQDIVILASHLYQQNISKCSEFGSVCQRVVCVELHKLALKV
jgi:hypothetical protein